MADKRRTKQINGGLLISCIDVYACFAKFRKRNCKVLRFNVVYMVFSLSFIFHICYRQLVFNGTLIDSLIDCFFFGGGGCDGRGEVVMRVAPTLLNTFKLWCEWS